MSEEYKSRPERRRDMRETIKNTWHNGQKLSWKRMRKFYGIPKTLAFRHRINAINGMLVMLRQMDTKKNS